MPDPANALLRASFGRALRTRRTARGITQEALALEAGISTTYVAMLERGEYMPTLAVIVKLAHVLDCAAWELVKDAEGEAR